MCIPWAVSSWFHLENFVECVADWGMVMCNIHFGPLHVHVLNSLLCSLCKDGVCMSKKMTPWTWTRRRRHICGHPWGHVQEVPLMFWLQLERGTDVPAIEWLMLHFGVWPLIKSVGHKWAATYLVPPPSIYHFSISLLSLNSNIKLPHITIVDIKCTHLELV